MINKIFVILIAVIASATLLIGLATWRQVDPPGSQTARTVQGQTQTKPELRNQVLT